MAESNEENQNDQSGENESAAEDIAGLKSALQKERDAAKQAARDVKRLSAELEALKGGSKSESEKLIAKLEAAESRIRESEGRDAVRTAAKKAGAADADIVYRFVKSDINFDDDGTPSNIDALIADAKQTAPQLFKPATTRVDAGSGNGSKPGKNDMNAMIRQAAGFNS